MRTDTSFATAADSVTAAETDATASTGMDFSIVNVDVNSPTLSVTTSPKHDIIGLASDLMQTTVNVNMKARDLPDDDESQRAPVDIIVALDVSGSMWHGKLDLCKKTLLLLLRVMYPKDRFGLICYAENATIDIPVQSMTESNKAKCIDKIKALRTRGNTNMSSAVGLVCEEMRQIENPNEVQTVFFLTDGHANAGISKPDALIEFTKNCFTHDNLTLRGTEGAEDQPSRQNGRRSWPFQRRQSGKKSDNEDAKPAAVAMDVDKPQNPITLHCFGFGSDHNSNLLQAMSEVVPGGSYYFVENDADVGGAFGDALGGILSVVAQNVVVTITVPEEAKAKGVEIVEVHHDNKVKRENGSYSIVVGDFYAEETRDVLFEVTLAKTSSGKSDPVPHVDVSVSYTDTLLKAPASANPTSCLIARPLGTEKSDCNPDVEAQLARLMATKAMAQANEMAMRSNYTGASECLRQAKAAVGRVAESAPAYQLESFAGIMDDFDELELGCASRGAWHSSGSKKMSNISATHKQQRSMKCYEKKTAGGSKRGDAYALKKKSKMMSDFEL